MRFLSFCIALFFTLFSAGVSSATENEYKVKAAMLYNFAKFVEWPANSFDGDRHITFCLTGKSPLNDNMLSMQGKLVKNRSVSIRLVDSSNNFNGCQILFIAQSESHRLSTYLMKARDHSVLTVSDLEQFAETGGMIGFNETGNRIGFEINHDEAQKRGIKISSQLLNLARRIR